MPDSVTPIILTCEADIAVTRRFVESFAAIRPVVKPPLVLVDQSLSPRLSGEYLNLIVKLMPSAVYVHPAEAGMSPYESVQQAANVALEWALHDSSEGDCILFLEDDVVFSSRFAAKVVNTYLGSETGFLTMYLPGNGYAGEVIDPSQFYGSQCLLFTRKAVAEIVEHRAEMMERFWPGYDIRWSRFLGYKGYVLYCAGESYVQHLPGMSRLHRLNSHTSNRFAP